MKQDSLEKFVIENRNAFDDKDPSERNWDHIADSIFVKASVSLWNSVSIWRAAALVLLGLSTYMFLSINNPVTKSQQRAAQQDFRDIENYYSAQISEKVALISNEGLFIDDNFTQDIEKLEAMYTVLAEEMKKHPSEKVKDALVLNMLVRVDLLNQQIQKLEELKREKREPASI